MAEKDNLFLAEFLNLGLKISLKLKIEAWVRLPDIKAATKLHFKHRSINSRDSEQKGHTDNI